MLVNHNPTPAEIRSACKAIQSTWSDVKRVYRATGLTAEEQKTIGPRTGYRFPTVSERIFGGLAPTRDVF